MDPTRPAVERLVDHARDLRDIAESIPPRLHETSLRLTRNDRIYCFERNLSRWPDGSYYMLDRGYDYWDRRARFSFTLDELNDLGVVAWGKGDPITTSYVSGVLPMAAECFQYNPRNWLPQYAALVGRLAEFVADRYYSRVRA